MNDNNPMNYQNNPYGTPQNNPYDAPQNNPYGAPQNNPYGAPQDNPYGAPQNNPYGAPQDNPYGAPQNNPYGAPVTPMSKEEFFENGATSFKKDIKFVLIICYICAAITAVFAVVGGAYLGLIDAGLLLGVTLGLQFKKHKGFAIAILALAIFEVAMAILAGTFSGWLWIVAGVTAVMAFRKAEKEYAAYLSGMGAAPRD